MEEELDIESSQPDFVDDGRELWEHYRFIADKGQALLRVDKFLVARINGTSRNRIQQAADAGCIIVNGTAVKSSYRVKPLDVVSIVMDRPKYENEIIPEDIPLDIVYEDPYLLVVNKPAGLVVHPGHGNYSGTLVNALAYHFKDNPDYDVNDPRMGLVHRIDKDTSGLLIVAKNDFAHRALASQIAEHSFKREYRAIVTGHLKEDSGTVIAPIGRNPNDRKKMAVTDKNSKNAVTHYETIEKYVGYSYLKLRLETGRTHQIRVHMAYLGHPLAGDTVYGHPPKNELSLGGQCLHAGLIGFVHPRTNEYMEFQSPLPDYFTKFQRSLTLED